MISADDGSLKSERDPDGKAKISSKTKIQHQHTFGNEPTAYITCMLPFQAHLNNKSDRSNGSHQKTVIMLKTPEMTPTTMHETSNRR